MTLPVAALAALRARTAPLRLVIYDCDGVLIDSEPVANRVCAAAISALGWPMDAAESNARFLGMSLSAMVPVIEAQTGARVPSGWVPHLAELLVAALATEAVAVDGAEAGIARHDRAGARLADRVQLRAG